MILKHIKTDKQAGEKEKDYIKAIFKGHYMAAHPNFPVVKQKVDERLESLEEKIQQLEDKKLHENEFGFDMLCEKYVDDCAMRIFQGMLSSGSCELSYVNAIEKSYDLAEAMLKEKLKRKNGN